ncbi:MAG: flavin reductase family protein [Deltaproteobacteria bacterium]|nr:flavin reductase family protein [Deltaproteobacteria bacterium]
MSGAPDPEVPAAEFRAALGSFAAGVTVVTSRAPDGALAGLTATSFTSVSLDPPLCLVCVARTADAHAVLARADHFGVSLLAADQRELSARFATHGADKFAGVAWGPGPATGVPLLGGAIATLECRVESRVAAGDHDVLIGRIQRVETRGGEPLLYLRGRYGTFQPA